MKVVLVGFLLVALAQGQSTADISGQNAVRPAKLERADLLRQLDTSLEQVVSKVSPAVVQILVSRYGPAATHGHMRQSELVFAMGSPEGLVAPQIGLCSVGHRQNDGTQHDAVLHNQPPCSRELRESVMRIPLRLK